MSNAIHYGQLKSEKLAEENQFCRQIVREISMFGVSERQRIMIIYLLAMEIENIEQFQAITCLVKEVAGKQLFLTECFEGDSDGTSNI